MTPYMELMDAVTQYYGAGSDEWLEIEKYGVSAPHLEEILSNIPNVSIVKNLDGSIRSFNFAATENITSSVETAVNSNVPAVMQTFDVPANTGIQEVTNAAGETVKQVTFKSGMAQAGNFVFGKVVPAVAAVSAGITLGKKFDKLLYNVDPDFWDEHGMSTLDPDKWGEIIGTDSFGGRVLNMILGTTPDNKTQAYIDQNALAYMALYMQNNGVFNLGETVATGKFANYDIVAPVYLSKTPPKFIYGRAPDGRYFEITIPRPPKNLTYALYKLDVDSESYGLVFGGTESSLNNEDVEYKWVAHYADGTTTTKTHDITLAKYTEANSVFYGAFLPPNINVESSIGFSAYQTNIAPVYGDRNAIATLAAALFGTISTNSGIDGIGTQDGATVPEISGINTVDGVLDKLKKQFPGLFEKAVTQNVVQPDGTIKPYTYVPVAMPELDPEGYPVSSPSTQANPNVDPATATEPLLKLITTLIQKDPPDNPPDTGKGHTPIVTPPTGSASALYAIYNPTLAQLNSFGAWLWSDNFVDQIKKLFNDPMQAIIGLHKVYATPATSGAQTIKVGYLDSGVSANVVSNQYTTIDCGTITLSEYFHNVFDYSPYTTVNLYLPFIGIVPLDNADVMRSSIHIVYHVDVLSGACLAEVKVTRDGAGGTLYQYTGNASVTLPISSGSYMGIVSSIASIAGGIAGTIASGGAALPMIASAAGSALNARTKIEHSGSFSGNAGAMGGKIPYLIISRPQIELAANYQQYIGNPSNFTNTLGNCHGYTEVIECHLENVSATNSELDEIKALLKEGVIL